MKLQCRRQKFQADAAKAVADVFAGQPCLTPTCRMDRGSGSYQTGVFAEETKGSVETMRFNHISPAEQAKIDCARAHFKAISGKNVECRCPLFVIGPWHTKNKVAINDCSASSKGDSYVGKAS